LLEARFTKKYKKVVHASWRMDEMYIKVKSEWIYQYRAVDKYGHTIDFFFSRKRDTEAAYRFFNKAIGYHGNPEKVTIDKSESNNAALEKINKVLPKKDRIETRQIKYLNNIVEQDHRFIKKITKPTI
jgi:transposase-like protein